MASLGRYANECLRGFRSKTPGAGELPLKQLRLSAARRHARCQKERQSTPRPGTFGRSVLSQQARFSADGTPSVVWSEQRSGDHGPRHPQVASAKPLHFGSKPLIGTCPTIDMVVRRIWSGNFGLRMAYGLATLSVLSVSRAFCVSSLLPTQLFVRHLLIFFNV
jgi:hypothetical protein